MKGLGEVTVISVAPNAVYHATGKRVRGLPITVEKIVLKGAMAGRRAVAVFRGLSLGIGSGIHPAINGEIRAGNVRGLRTGDERHQGGDLINMAVAVERCGAPWSTVDRRFNRQFTHVFLSRKL